jgi:hypothetical protein
MEGPPLTLTPSAALRSRGVTSDQPRKPDFTPPITPPTTLTPPSVLPPAGTTAPPRSETPPRAGKAGDVVKAILGLDPVKKAVDTFVTTQKTQLDKKLSPGEKAAVVTTVVTIGAGALAGIWSDPAARKEALGLVNGQEVPVPGVPGMKVQVLTQPGGGAVLKFDLTKIVPQLK